MRGTSLRRAKRGEGGAKRRVGFIRREVFNDWPQQLAILCLKSSGLDTPPVARSARHPPRLRRRREKCSVSLNPRRERERDEVDQRLDSPPSMPRTKERTTTTPQRSSIIRHLQALQCAIKRWRV